jgi:hypothetical protein
VRGDIVAAQPDENTARGAELRQSPGAKLSRPSAGERTHVCVLNVGADHRGIAPGGMLSRSCFLLEDQHILNTQAPKMVRGRGTGQTRADDDDICGHAQALPAATIAGNPLSLSWRA